MNTNIKSMWDEIRGRATQEWMDRIGSNLIPELTNRGWTKGSVYAIDPAPGNEFIGAWGFTKGEVFLEIMAHTSTAFSAHIIVGTNKITWPNLSMSIFDRKNYTIGFLLEWIDHLTV